MKHFLICFSILLTTVSVAQLTDDFSDGDFTANPIWGGHVDSFIVNTSDQVQLNATDAATAYLSTAHNLTTLDDQEWRVWLKISTSPSGGNFGRYYLTSSAADLSTDPDGFYLQLGEGGSTDAVRLMKNSGGTTTEICASADGSIASSFEIAVRVVRDNTGLWSLYIDNTGGENFAFESSATDTENLMGTHLGYICTYTSSNATKYYFDEVYAGAEILDTEPPEVISVEAINANQIDVLFNEEVTTATVEDENNYDIIPFQSVTTATLDGTNPALVHLTPQSALANGNTYTITISNIEDVEANAMTSSQHDFSYYVAETPNAGDVIINEFMCDPSPVVGLPEVEFVEVFNRSNKIFNLENWQLGDAASFGAMGNHWLLPGEYAIVCATGSITDYPDGVATTSFPSLNNSDDSIIVLDDLGTQIDLVYYTNDWYHDADKDNGGWTIERINPNAPCSGEENWSAAVDASGGTPGSQNSIFDDTPDTTPPAITDIFTLTSSSVQVVFNEGMDSLSLENANLSTSPALTEQNRIVATTFPTEMTTVFAETFVPSQEYTLTLENIADCWGNTTTTSGTFALPEAPEIGDVIINEILFNSYTGGGDWVELHNVSDKLLDLENWAIANYDDDTISNHDYITSNLLLKPGEYVVLSEDPEFDIQNYPAAVPENFYEMDLPTLTNDSSTVYLLFPSFFTSPLMDYVSYSDDWHFKLLDDEDGKSLERIDPAGPSNNASNWHTAAEAVGFGTPGRENSQYNPAITSGELSFTSDVISPDNDGFEDVLQINYEMEQGGLVGTIKIYDDRGREIQTIMDSELLGNRGTVTWDGVRENGAKASIGTYVLVFEAFGIDGAVAFIGRKAFVVAGKL